MQVQDEICIAMSSPPAARQRTHLCSVVNGFCNAGFQPGWGYQTKQSPSVCGCWLAVLIQGVECLQVRGELCVNSRAEGAWLTLESQSSVLSLDLEPVDSGETQSFLPASPEVNWPWSLDALNIAFFCRNWIHMKLQEHAWVKVRRSRICNLARFQ